MKPQTELYCCKHGKYLPQISIIQRHKNTTAKTNKLKQLNQMKQNGI